VTLGRFFLLEGFLTWGCFGSFHKFFQKSIKSGWRFGSGCGIISRSSKHGV